MRQVGSGSPSALRAVCYLCLLVCACQSSQGADDGGDGLTNGACEVTAEYARCASQAIVTVGGDRRAVYWAGPSGQPAGGLPAVVLFQGSIGRSDFPRGDHQALVSSIRNKLFPLGDDITFIPGHGPTSTFGQERLSNPFVADSRYG